MANQSSAAPAVLAVFGLEDATVRWLTRALRDAGVVGVHVRPDLTPAAAHSVLSAVDAGVHIVSARRGMDATFLEYWQLLTEMGAARYVAVCDLGPATLDVNDTSAIASRVLEEDVHPITMPLLDDDESVIGVLDVVTGEQWFPAGSVQAPRQDFVDAVEAERNVLLDESGGEVLAAVRSGEFAVAVTVDAHSRAGVDWLAGHLPPRSVPAASTVLPDSEAQLLAAGPDALPIGPALAVLGSEVLPVEVRSLHGILEPALLSELKPGEVAAALLQPLPPLGSLLLPG